MVAHNNEVLVNANRFDVIPEFMNASCGSCGNAVPLHLWLNCSGHDVELDDQERVEQDCDEVGVGNEVIVLHVPVQLMLIVVRHVDKDGCVGPERC